MYEAFACKFCLFHQGTGARSRWSDIIFGLCCRLQPSARATERPNHLGVGRCDLAHETLDVAFFDRCRPALRDPAAEQQDIDVEPMIVLQGQAQAGNTGASVGV
ncbi:hypothetical protein ATE67_02325 [Sphingopyxis sp. H050]|nr:hypothetical protein ATE67_02325 [Sphingopyxis sp. H050]